ncbi:hypothetical protein [Streptomyces sp. VRA16 Mangrove soil]|uniref:hypothetical protein n=1 Tax=Streptomyces sp. VRA16 Mangrove soil TaxID=2817434 RepID=UPI001A9CD676|nr:hypothetical protein [Streptomyces sp. VRA16 Mangrove soil]MBO1334663.1 hypothetical protein [Streptomyces sp. VRA16 Mangrove soil]
MAASGDGYQVRHSGMTSQAKELDGAGDDAGAIRELLAGTPCYTQEVLGGDDAGPAFNAYASAWTAESRTIEDALHELADKVRAAKGAYGGSDRLVQTSASNVTVGTNAVGTNAVGTQSAYGTNPVYGGSAVIGSPPIGTNPVYGDSPVIGEPPVGTGPTPAGDELISTDPVHAEVPSALTDY